MMRIKIIILLILLLPAIGMAATPLHVHPTNPRYFTDDTGNAIRLGGHQIFVDNQDNIFSKTYTYNWQTLLDWDWYMGFMNTRNLNYIRS